MWLCHHRLMRNISLTTYFSQLQNHLLDIVRIHGDKLIITMVIAIIAMAIGALLAHFLAKTAQGRKREYVYHFIAPLVSPLLLIAAMAGVYGYAQSENLDITPYFFGLKLAFSWFMIRFVYRISSKQEAGWIITFLILPLMILLVLGLLEDFTTVLDGIAISFGEQRVTALMVFKGLATIIILFWLSGKLMREMNKRISHITRIHISHRTLISKLVQIFLYFVVFVIAMQIIGIDLTALSVFGGALGVGIGFGLQKIASNFISGIILLLERSIQVDDLVELSDGTIGFIKKTGARYTLMETFDCKEILIPNEEFITQRTTSWTHSNKLGRIEVEIGVAYHSDLDLVRKIMLEEAAKHPRSAKNSPPKCILNSFGDSAINFTLFFYVEDVKEGRLEARSEVMMAVWKSFKQQGIEIPFPQRVVHYAKDA
jgi:small-conductance mechanosensitive channel